MKMKDSNTNDRERKIYSFNLIAKVMAMIKMIIMKTRSLTLKQSIFPGFLREGLLNPSLSILVTRKKVQSYSQIQLSNILFYSSGVISGVHSFIIDISPS
jgi:hypothetical protein